MGRIVWWRDGGDAIGVIGAVILQGFGSGGWELQCWMRLAEEIESIVRNWRPRMIGTRLSVY